MDGVMSAAVDVDVVDVIEIWTVVATSRPVVDDVDVSMILVRSMVNDAGVDVPVALSNTTSFPVCVVTSAPVDVDVAATNSTVMS